MISELKTCPFPFAGKWMWHSASLSTLLSLSLALISDANLWSANNKGNWRILTCRYCGCCRSVYSERDGKWDVFHLHLHRGSILIICCWHVAAACCALGNQLSVALLEGGKKWEMFCWVGGYQFSLDLYFPGSQRVWICCLWKVISILLWVWMFQLGNQIPFEMCQGAVINQRCSNWKGSNTTRNRRCVPCWKWWQPSTEHASKNILKLFRAFVIKSNLNKIIALLFTNWKLVRFYRYTLIVLQEMQNSREIFGGMETYWCQLVFKGKIKEWAVHLSVKADGVPSELSILLPFQRRQSCILLSTAAPIHSLTCECLWAGLLKSLQTRAVTRMVF